MKFLRNFIAVTIFVLLALTNNCDAGKFGGGRSSSRSSHSRSSPSHRSPSHHYSHPSPSPSHKSGGWSFFSKSSPSPSPSPSYSHPSPSHSYNHPASAPPSYSTISKGTSYSSGSHPPYAPPAYSPRAPQIPTAPKGPIAPPAYNPSYGWKVTPKHTGTQNVAHIPYTAQQNSGYGRPSPNPVGPVGPITGPAATISATKTSQTSSNYPGHNGGINSGLNYPRQQYIQPNHNNPPSYTNQNHFSSPPHQPTVVNNFITTNHQSNFHTPSYSPAPYHFVSYNHYPSTYYSPFHDYYPISLGLHLYSSSHLGYGGYNDHHHYHHHTYSNSPANTNSYPSNSGSNQNNNNIPNAGGSYQNGTTNDKPDPFERSQPLIYTIPAQKKGDDDDADSTEIIFANPYLIVGVENVLFYGEFHDDEDAMIFIDQGSDGLEPVQPAHQPNYNADVNLTPSTTTIANNNTIILGTTTLAPSTETTTDNQKRELPSSETLSVNTTSQPILSTSTISPGKLYTIEE